MTSKTVYECWDSHPKAIAMKEFLDTQWGHEYVFAVEPGRYKLAVDEASTYSVVIKNHEEPYVASIIKDAAMAFSMGWLAREQEARV